jgi:two-component sensor histidine kinase
VRILTHNIEVVSLALLRQKCRFKNEKGICNVKSQLCLSSPNKRKKGMSEKKPRDIASPYEHSDSIRRLEPKDEPTETIDLHSLLTQDLTDSGSFDIRGDIWATTFGKLLQSLPIPAFLLDRSQRIVVANQASGRISADYMRVLDCQFCTLFPNSEYSERVKAILEEVFSSRRPQVGEGMLQIAKERIWGRMTFRSIRIMDHRFILVLVEDLSAEKKRFYLIQKHEAELLKVNEELHKEIAHRKEAEQQLKISLSEKGILLREIHHRVKNNLAVIVSLLRIQSRYIPDEASREMFEDSQNRIRSMALAHELLYLSEKLVDITVREYLGRLLDHLFVSSKVIGMPISITQEIEEVSFGLDTGIPVGFIVTELISNCLKHAFPDGGEGNIRISLRSIDEKEFELVVRDNGLGIPEDVDLKNPKSLGLVLVGMFVEQLKGKVEIVRQEGTEVRIRFKGKKHQEA